MAVKREDERYSSDPMDDLAGIVERVENRKKDEEAPETSADAPQQNTPAFQMKVTGDLRDTGKKRRR